MSDQRIDDFRETHFPIEELGQTFCAEDSQHWPCDSGYVLDALAAAQATIAQRDAQVAALCATVRRAHNDRDAHIAIGQAFVDEINRLNEQLAARDAQVAELTAALEELTDTWHDTIHGVEESVEIMRACPKDVCKRNRELLARTPAAPEGEADA